MDYNILKTSAVALLFSTSMAWAQDDAPYTYAKRFSPDGQLLGEILPDPDGSGPLPRSAIRYTYNSRGLLQSTEYGALSHWQTATVAPADWTDFTVHTTQTVTYTALGQKRTEKLSGRSAEESLTHYSYDTNNRLKCQTVRMNPDTWGALPASACQPGIEGDFGPDRVTQFTYKLNGQLEKEEKGLGTSVHIDEKTYTYNSLGQMQSVTDARNFKTVYEYDERGRLEYWYFPSKTGTNVENRGDYEQYGYDDNDNRVSLRKRDGLTTTYTYDNLNRQTRKYLPDGTGVKYQYDLRGLQTKALNLTHAINAEGGLQEQVNAGIETSYDGFGRLESSQDFASEVSRNRLTYQYDDNGNRTRVTHADNHFFHYSFDGLDRLTHIRSNATTGTAILSQCCAPFSHHTLCRITGYKIAYFMT